MEIITLIYLIYYILLLVTDLSLLVYLLSGTGSQPPIIPLKRVKTSYIVYFLTAIGSHACLLINQLLASSGYYQLHTTLLVSNINGILNIIGFLIFAYILWNIFSFIFDSKEKGQTIVIVFVIASIANLFLSYILFPAGISLMESLSIPFSLIGYIWSGIWQIPWIVLGFIIHSSLSQIIQNGQMDPIERPISEGLRLKFFVQPFLLLGYPILFIIVNRLSVSPTLGIILGILTLGIYLLISLLGVVGQFFILKGIKKWENHLNQGFKEPRLTNYPEFIDQDTRENYNVNFDSE